MERDLQEETSCPVRRQQGFACSYASLWSCDVTLASCHLLGRGAWSWLCASVDQAEVCAPFVKRPDF